MYNACTIIRERETDRYTDRSGERDMVGKRER